MCSNVLKYDITDAQMRFFSSMLWYWCHLFMTEPAELCNLANYTFTSAIYISVIESMKNAHLVIFFSPNVAVQGRFCAFFHSRQNAACTCYGRRGGRFHMRLEAWYRLTTPHHPAQFLKWFYRCFACFLFFVFAFSPRVGSTFCDSWSSGSVTRGQMHDDAFVFQSLCGGSGCISSTDSSVPVNANCGRGEQRL